MEKVSTDSTKKEKPTPKPPADDSSKTTAEPVAESEVVSQTTAPVHDVHTDRRPDFAAECSTEKLTTITDPGAVVLMEELLQSFSSKEEAMKVFAIFSAMPREQSTGATITAPSPPTIPEETTAQPSISHTEEPKVSIGALAHDQSHAETGQSTSTAECDAEEGGGQADDGDLAVVLERMAVEERKDDEANKGETPVSGENSEGETLL